MYGATFKGFPALSFLMELCRHRPRLWKHTSFSAYNISARVKAVAHNVCMFAGYVHVHGCVLLLLDYGHFVHAWSRVIYVNIRI